MLTGLTLRGFRITLLIPDGRCDADALNRSGVDIQLLRLNGRMDRRAIRTIRTTVQTQKFNLVHCLRNNRPIANTLLALRGARIPIVCYRGTMGNLSKWDPGSRLTYLSRRLDRIVCVSDAVRNDLLTLHLSPERLVTIYKGHDPAWYNSPTVDLSEFGIPEHAFVVGCTANMRPLKGADVLIQSVRHLKSDRPIHFLLVGEVRDSRISAYFIRREVELGICVASVFLGAGYGPGCLWQSANSVFHASEWAWGRRFS